MKNIYKTILHNRELNRKMLAVLLDPEQCRGSVLSSTVAVLKSNTPDFIFVGGGHTISSTDSFIELLKDEIQTDIVSFPGNASQFSPKADALLFLSLLSGRNAEFIIGQQVTSAIALKKSDLEVISTAYLLVDGNKPSAVEYLSNTRPIPRHEKEIALSTALAAELLGMRIIYLEAGIDASIPVHAEMIEHLSTQLSVPLIVGGGIKTVEQLTDAYDAGADLVVVGNIFEGQPARIAEFVACTKAYGMSEEE